MKLKADPLFAKAKQLCKHRPDQMLEIFPYPKIPPLYEFCWRISLHFLTVTAATDPIEFVRSPNRGTLLYGILYE